MWGAKKFSETCFDAPKSVRIIIPMYFQAHGPLFVKKIRENFSSIFLCILVYFGGIFGTLVSKKTSITYTTVCVVAGGGGAAPLPPRTPRPQDKRILVYTPSVLVANHTHHGHLQSYIYTFIPRYNSSQYTPSVLLHVTITIDTFLPLHTTRPFANHTKYGHLQSLYSVC